MASLDIGIDLGTSTILASNSHRGIVFNEPAVVAVNRRTGNIIGIGRDVQPMIGKTPDHIQVVRPLEDGVISDFNMTGVLVKYLLRKITRNQLVKPRVIVCVPSQITGVESQSVIDATVNAGARRVYLIEEPVAAAIGAGLDIAKPNGRLVVDVGGGTTDMAVLSLGGVVCKSSLKVAGRRFDEAVARHIRTTHNLLIGEKMAENTKKEIGSVWDNSADVFTDVKGRDLISGLPRKVQVTRGDLLECLQEEALQIVAAVQNVLERTPPELVGDIRDNGIVITGGGGMIHGFDKLLSRLVKVETRVADEAVECVAKGTVQSFAYLGTVFDGFVRTSTHTH